MDLRRDFSLKRLALLSWCTSFWNRQSINCKVQQMISDVKLAVTTDLIVLAKNELKAMDLPVVIYDELIQRIAWFGERVLKWYRRCSDIGLPGRFTREIHWTVFGTIDEAKTVEKNFIGPDVILSSDSEMFGMYYMACTSALKDYINLHASEIIDFCRKHEKEMEYRHSDIPLFYRSVLTLANPESLNLSGKEKDELISKYFRNIGCSKEAFMFRLSVRKGYTAAAEYYWQQLSSLEKENNLMSVAMKCIQSYAFDIDVLVFLLSEMSENQRATFFGHIVVWRKTSECLRILQAFMKSCAWEYHFFPIFYLFEKLKEPKEKYLYDVLNRIISAWKERLNFGLHTKNHVHKQIFLAVWGKLKTILPENHHYDSCFVRNIFELFEVDVFNIVLREYRFRQELLELGRPRYKNLLLNFQFELLEEFMQTVLTSRGERVRFREKLISNLDDVGFKIKLYIAANFLYSLLV